VTVPAHFSCSLALERDEKRSGAEVALGPAPPSAVLLRARPSCSGPRTHSRTTAGRTGAVPREPTGPGPGHRTHSFAAASAGVRSLCVVFIQLQIKQDYDRELDARAAKHSVGKCLRERNDEDHRIPPRNGEQNWHTVRSGCCKRRRGFASRIRQKSPVTSSVLEAVQLLVPPCRVGTDRSSLLKNYVNFPFSYTLGSGLEWHLPFEG